MERRIMKSNVEFRGYIGTYTTGESRGIYKFTLNVKDKRISHIDLAAELDNPTYLCVDKDNSYLYSVIKSGGKGGVAAFDMDSSKGELKLINFKAEKGSPPCHVNIDSRGKYVFSANYHRGIVEVFPIGENGGLENRRTIAVHTGSGPHKNQASAHVHYVSLTPDEKYLCAVDLGIDELSVYSFKNGDLKEENNRSVHFNPGSGPRHMVFHPKLNIVYVITELSSEITVLEYCKWELEFKKIQTVSTLPENYSGENAGGAIHLSQDGKYLYVSNRGHDSIAVFSIDGTGKIALVEHVSTCGSFPRDFEIDPTDRFLIAGNQKSDNLILFERDMKNGRLNMLDENIKAPCPVCIKFID